MELSKQQKGRFKKLRKRAAEIEPNSDVSGLQKQEDLDELKSYLTTTPPGPCVAWRKHKVRESTEGNDHRDILYRCLYQSSAFPSWATLHNPIAVKHVGILEIHTDRSLDLAPLFEQQQYIKADTKWFSSLHPQSISSVLMYTPKERPHKRQKTTIQSMNDLYQALMQLTVTQEQWNKEDYPQPRAIAVEASSLLDWKAATEQETIETIRKRLEPFSNNGYVYSKNDADESSQIFALDCEMVQTQNGFELARVTLIELLEHQPSFETRIVLDEVVKPYYTITDYLTRYSGLKASDFEHVDTRIEHVQLALLRIVKNSSIVIGHSIENDLKALKWVHSNVVDTALLFRPDHGRFKYKLQLLARRLLRIDIQNGEHCSEEDANAALELAVRRAIEGPVFGIWDNSQENRLVKVAGRDTVVCVGPSEWLQSHVANSPSAIHALTCESIHETNTKAIASWLIGPRRRAKVVWGNWSIESESDEDTLKSFISNLLSKYNSTDTLLMVAIQSGFQKAHETHLSRKVRRNPKATMSWTDTDEETWKTNADAARPGQVYWVGGIIK